MQARDFYFAVVAALVFWLVFSRFPVADPPIDPPAHEQSPFEVEAARAYVRHLNTVRRICRPLIDAGVDCGPYAGREKTQSP